MTDTPNAEATSESVDTSATTETTAASPQKLTDPQRLRLAARNHGLVALAALTLWAAADSWLITSGLMLASGLAIVNALVAGTILGMLIHEWGHFTGARLAKAYSPMVTNPTGVFIFGFRYDKNTDKQFLAMSLGGPAANLLLLLAVFTLVPLDNAGRAMLLAVALVHAASALLFEVPIMLRVMQGMGSEESLEQGLNDGSQDRSKVIAYALGLIVWLILL